MFDELETGNFVCLFLLSKIQVVQYMPLNWGRLDQESCSIGKPIKSNDN